MRWLFFFLLVTSWLAACAQHLSQPTVNANTAFELASDNTVRLVDNDIAFPVTVLQIQDSRCPINANCIWMGEAKVQLLLNDELSKSLCLGDCADKDPKANEANFRLQGERYTITLHDVQPYPADSVPAEEPKKAVLTIKRVTL